MYLAEQKRKTLIMFSFFGLRKDSKKSTPEKEVDGGFVIIGETVDDQRRRMQNLNVAQLSTNVVVQPSKSSCAVPAQPTYTMHPTALPTTAPIAGTSAVEAASTLPDLLGDIPFTLAPHVLAMQAGFPLIPDVLLSRDINYNLSSFQYDFTLENSVLHNA
ncbi:UBAP1-MVB12-associated (UMA)-domain containing protein 1 isoform X2 [Micropterus dolomieu]|uniref:UBAP1-MVB12-associated (UMA)-domain containing protein 1 isoform X2 n=1 Tax=Micropterus dolomieu TaxID=147949 RepID=UPI001E8D2C66|nr:UBAP1-MVB12-associated (UMA)-domain containing protein 1 isoform X2 [Micropterus dolomieu]